MDLLKNGAVHCCRAFTIRLLVINSTRGRAMVKVSRRLRRAAPLLHLLPTAVVSLRGLRLALHCSTALVTDAQR